jgi:hypothetical protein
MQTPGLTPHTCQWTPWKGESTLVSIYCVQALGWCGVGRRLETDNNYLSKRRPQRLWKDTEDNRDIAMDRGMGRGGRRATLRSG